jgi:hypothetical protein
VRIGLDENVPEVVLPLLAGAFQCNGVGNGANKSLNITAAHNEHHTLIQGDGIADVNNFACINLTDIVCVYCELHFENTCLCSNFTNRRK